MKHLYKSKTNKTWEGIIGGLGEYFNIDATLLRVIFLVFVVITGIFPGVIIYILAIFIIPNAPDTPSRSDESTPPTES